MPKAAIHLGAVQRVVPLHRIAMTLTNGAAMGHSPSADRRKHHRYVCILEATLVDGANEVFHPVRLARVVNISQGGLALHAAEKFDAGTRLTIKLKSERVPTAVAMKVHILHALEQPNGTWMMGAEFVDVLGEEQVRAILSEPPP
jgi:hypothetical protein